ncbi:PREDICTED: trichohyalin-like, partial [Apaloderma vittatum]|uniref:trichohyalin-like n=1 Tax=Apaloderma vittatum TaxID=57397 RepID=UPI0005218A8A
MSRFLDSITTIIGLFHKSAKADGNHSSLSRRKMKELIEREFADVIAKPHDPQTIDKILHFLEWDGDGEIDFNEFLLLVFRVAKACYWYLPKGPHLLQRTKLTTTGKPLQELEIKNRGSCQQLQEEEQDTCERSRHPACKTELQRDTSVIELEVREEARSRHQERNTPSRNVKRSSEPGEPIPQVYEEGRQEPCDQRNSRRRRDPPEPDRRDVQFTKRGSVRAQESRLRADERRYEEADVRSCSQTYEPQPRPNQWSNQAHDQKTQQPQEGDRGRNNKPRKPEIVREERSHYHLREVEQKESEYSSHDRCEPECLESRRPHQSYIEEPLQLDLRYGEAQEPERKRRIQQAQELDGQNDRRREKPVRERKIDRLRELDLEVYEQREREEQDATTIQRERREREGDERRQRELEMYERTRETEVAAAEAQVKIHRVSREAEPPEQVKSRDCRRECEEPEERRICQEREREKPVRETRDRQREFDLQVYEEHEREERDATTIRRERREREGDGRRQRELEMYERTRETEVAAAEADVRIHRVSREVEPREQVEKRDRCCE